MILDPSCTAERKCWDHYGPHQRAQASERACQLALDFIHLCHRVIGPWPSIEELQRLNAAIDCLISLRSRQWREMTRKPFEFSTPIPRPICTQLSLDDILGEI